MADVVVIGSIAYDTIKTPFGAAKDTLGGSATYAAMGASFFAKAGIVAPVGSDFSHMEEFSSRGISTAGVRVLDGKTFRWSGYYEYDMNHAHTTETQLNVFEGFVPEIPEEYMQAKAVFLGNIDPELQLSVLEQMQPAITVADTMDYWIERKRDSVFDVIKKSTVFLLNDAEARELMNTTSLATAGRKILSFGPDAVVIKKGEHGVVMFSKNEVFFLPGYPLENVKDPTGAGDSFGGAFTGYLAKSSFNAANARKAVAYGSAVASFSVEDFGLGRLRQISMDDIEGRYREFGAMVRF